MRSCENFLYSFKAGRCATGAAVRAVLASLRSARSSHRSRNVNGLLHDEHMTDQLVVKRDEAGREVLTLTPTDDRSPFSFESVQADTWIPRLGTYDLLRVANWVSEHDYLVDEIQAVGIDGAPIDEADEELLNHELLPKIGNAREAADLLRTRFPGYTLVSVALTSPTMHHLRLRRLGRVDTDNPDEAQSSLRDAWRVLKFS